MQAARPATNPHPHLPTALAAFTCPEAQQPVLHKLGAVLPQRNLLHTSSSVCTLGSSMQEGQAIRARPEESDQDVERSQGKAIQVAEVTLFLQPGEVKVEGCPHHS